MAAPRRATADDIDLVTSIVTLAFADDPLWSRAMARPDGETYHRADLWRILVEGGLRYPETWITDGGEATSIWIPPDGSEMSDEQEGRLRGLVAAHLGSADDYYELMARFEAAHPRGEPHYYLSLLGTHPQHRGHGIGMKLLSHNLAIIDSEHQPAYLESSNPNNNNRYKRLGFEPYGEFSYPGGGPLVTTMWRPAC